MLRWRVLAALRRPTPPVATGIGAFLLVFLAVLLFLPLLVGDRALYFGDLSLYFIPLLAFQRRELLEGQIPLWNPHLLNGTPFVGNPQSWPLYPSSLLLYLLPAHRAVGVIGVLHLALAAVGMLLFLRRRGLLLAPALLGAVTFGFGGALVSKMQFPNMVQAAAFLPWLLWSVEGVAARPTAGRQAALIVTIGLALLAAHAQVFLMQFYLCGAWALWRVRALPPEHRARVGRALAGALAVGVLLAMVQLLPTLDLIRSSMRVELKLAKANRFILPPGMLLTAFVLPNFYGNPSTGEYIGRGNFWEPCAYAGLLPFALAVGIIGREFRRSSEIRFWTVTVLVTLWLSLGRIGGLYIIAFKLVPGVGKFHDPARWLHLATFALACLAAWGLHALMAAYSSRQAYVIAALAVAVTLLDLFPFVRGLNPTVDSRVFGPTPFLVQCLRRHAPGRLFHRDNDVVWRRFATYRTYRNSDAARVQELLGTLAPNLPMLYGLRSADGYEPIRRADSALLLDRLRKQTQKADRRGRESPLLRAAAVGYVLSLRPHPPRISGLGAGFGTGDLRAQPVLGAVPRAALWTAWRGAPTERAARNLFLSGGDQALPIVPGAQGRRGDAPIKPQAARIVEETPNRLVVNIPSHGSEPRLLVVADTYHPGWSAWADARPAPLQSINGLFRGVFVGADVRQVEFRYAPLVWRLGVFLSLVGLGIVAGTTGFAIASHRKRSA